MKFACAYTKECHLLTISCYDVMSVKNQTQDFMMIWGDKSTVCCRSQYWEPGNAVSEL